MKTTIPILAHTHLEYCDHIRKALGKGHVHAKLLYEEWFRQGTALGKDAAFDNAQELLKEILRLTHFSLPVVLKEKHDGITGKFLLQTHDHLEVEAVMIPMRTGNTLCISSQVGCRKACAFCETGRMGLIRNLTVEEIVVQVFIARFLLKFPLRNVVFMGMGEPFDNFENVMQAFRILTDPHGLGIGKKRITVSTSGCVEGIHRLIEAGSHAPNLAISLNAADDELRNWLMPINRKYNLQALHDAMRHYNILTGKDILLAYVLMKEQNDSISHAEALAAYLRGLKVKINLIPYNPQSHDRFQPSDGETVEMFSRQLREAGYYTLLRTTKGRKIMAGCGQLGNLHLRKNRFMGKE